MRTGGDHAADCGRAACSLEIVPVQAGLEPARPLAVQPVDGARRAAVAAGRVVHTAMVASGAGG